ncbi:MAG: glycosyltransferase family 9 protein, partial [Methylophilaceae bacterium]|nr:glycosyltransferase family 9 protein [Methylophilaceae bacterium]
GVSPQDIQEDLIFPTIFPDTVHLKIENQIKQIFDFNYKGLIAINPNASDTSLERRWPQENFAKISNYFANQGYAVALVGSNSEYDYVNQIIEMGANNKKSIKNLAGRFSLLEFLVFLEQCNLLITNDSGIMNMALTMKLPQLLLAGPVSPNQYFIKNNFRSYIYYQTYCSPCTHNVDSPPCGGDNKCMQEISVKEVIVYAEGLLSGKIMTPKHQIIFSSDYETLGVLKNKGIL